MFNMNIFIKQKILRFYVAQILDKNKIDANTYIYNGDKILFSNVVINNNQETKVGMKIFHRNFLFNF